MKRSNFLRSLLFTAVVLILNISIYSQIQQSCYTPGSLVVSDANENLTYQFDIEKVSAAEPFYGDGSDKLALTLKVQGLSPLPLGSWNIFIKGTDNVQRFVQMSTLLGTPQYRYGTVTFLLGIPLFNYQGNIQGSFSRDGEIKFFIDKNKIGNPQNGQNLMISGKTFIRPLIDLLQVDQTSEEGYGLVGNDGCTPFNFTNWGRLGDVPLTGNYNRNGRADFTVYRPDNNVWYSVDPFTNEFEFFQWGDSNLDDIPVAGDFDTDNRQDWTVYRPSTGTWHIYQRATNTSRSVNFGAEEDLPISADFDGDRINDIAVYRPSIGSWFILSSIDGTFKGIQFGASEDVPVVADYDGDGKDDAAVFRPSNGAWYVSRSSDLGFQSAQFGVGTDEVVPGDYDGDGKSDYAVWRNSTGVWYVWRSSTNDLHAYQWGMDADKPVQADYDGNGQTDFAVWRPETGIWYVTFN